MKTNSIIIAVVAAALSATVVLAADVDHQRSSARNAEAKFQYVDTSICSDGIVTNVTVLGILGSFASNGKAVDISVVGLSLEAHDECSGRTVLFATGQTNGNFDLRIDPNLKTATLHVRLLVHDFLNNTSGYFDIDMAWTGIGPTQKDAIHDKKHSPGLIENEHVVMAVRDAAVAGSVISLATGQDFTPGAPVSARLQTMRGGGNDVPIH